MKHAQQALFQLLPVRPIQMHAICVLNTCRREQVVLLWTTAYVIWALLWKTADATSAQLAPIMTERRRIASLARKASIQLRAAQMKLIARNFPSPCRGL